MNNAANSFNIEIADFGPISKAEMDLRPLTVFVGPSNTGKSYLAILIYALHKFFHAGGLVSGRFSFMRSASYETIKKENIPQETIEWIKESFGEKKKITAVENVAIPSFMIDKITRFISQSSVSTNILEDEVCRCFGVAKISSLIRRGNKNGARATIKLGDNSDFAQHNILIGARKADLATKIPEFTNIQLDDERQIEDFRIVTLMGSSENWDNNSIYMLIQVLADSIMRQVFGPLHFRPFYLPADRTGIMHAHSAVVSALIANAPRGALRPSTRTAMLSGVLADFLEQLIELDSRWPRRSKSRPDLGALIENKILEGAVRTRRSRTTGYPTFTYRPNGWKQALPLMNASSMVSELAPVILYLRHLVRPDNVLIVEEPESHLHPGMQVEFTRQLAAIVGTGVRVIVTTHSEWILEELANLVQISELPDDARRGLPNGGAALRADQVGAWLFEPRGEGSVVEEICLDETGLYPSGFSKVSAALHNNWAEIRSRMGKSK